MIIEYSRPKTMEEALSLLKREHPKTVPLGGGSTVSKQRSEDVAVVDLQDLGLNYIKKENGTIRIGATTPLSVVEEFMGVGSFSEALQIETGQNLRNSGTLAGLICTADGRSPFLTLLLALDARLVWENGAKESAIGDWLPVREVWRQYRLITEIVFAEAEVRFDSIGRSPKDRPILCCAEVKGVGDKLRGAIGGFGKIPTLVSDGKMDDDLQVAIVSALSDAEDEWASVNYRQEAGVVMANRLKTDLITGK